MVEMLDGVSKEFSVEVIDIYIYIYLYIIYIYIYIYIYNTYNLYKNVDKYENIKII